MGFITQIGGRLRAILLMTLLAGVVVLDSISTIISMCVDGFLAVLIVAVVWPILKAEKESPEKKL